MDIITQAGSSIAFPSQTTYLESGKGFDKEPARLGESRMKGRREGTVKKEMKEK